MKWSLLALVLVVAVARPAAAQCTKDTDCKGDRICEAGACATPARSQQVKPEQPLPVSPEPADQSPVESADAGDEPDSALPVPPPVVPVPVGDEGLSTLQVVGISLTAAGLASAGTWWYFGSQAIEAQDRANVCAKSPETTGGTCPEAKYQRHVDERKLNALVADIAFLGANVLFLGAAGVLVASILVPSSVRLADAAHIEGPELMGVGVSPSGRLLVNGRF